jgi:nucleoside-diphosphate-sugar epimerase
MTETNGRILVTGAGGFIGRRMLALLRAQGHVTIGLDRLPAEAGMADKWIVADLTAGTPVQLPSDIGAIIHLAGKAHALSEVAQDEAEYFRINLDGTRQVLEAARRAGVRGFVFFSTIKAAADWPGGDMSLPADESWDAEPDTPYGSSKRAAEKLVLEGGYVPHPVVLRPCLVYGPTPKGNLAKMIDAVARGRFPPLPEVNNRRSMVHLDDVILAAILAMASPAAAGQRYIVADNEPFSTRQLFEWICAAVGRPVPRWSVPPAVLRLLGLAGDTVGRLRGRRFIFDSAALAKLIGSAWYSSARLQRELGWRPAHTLRESLPEICAAAKKSEGGR